MPMFLRIKTNHNESHPLNRYSSKKIPHLSIKSGQYIEESDLQAIDSLIDEGSAQSCDLPSHQRRILHILGVNSDSM
ncbi:Hypothetical predicted protein [Octopus vulgaris]|uniref:Uncharacterized protein n=1 Tax=Octopus vulgaris TaxID=6645 RepID=A0AA36AGW4_OCTVU|nr:Hypothetical predicted protein [Octopus vulgaris]